MILACKIDNLCLNTIDFPPEELEETLDVFERWGFEVIAIFKVNVYALRYGTLV